MLPKNEKFTSQDFSLIKKLKPKKHFTNIGVFCIYPAFSADQAEAKFAIVPSKKIFKTAVARNKHKRYFFGSIKEILKKEEKNLFCLVFYPSKIFTKKEIKSELTKILSNS